jgi:hypothetical protein
MSRRRRAAISASGEIHWGSGSGEYEDEELAQGDEGTASLFYSPYSFLPQNPPPPKSKSKAPLQSLHLESENEISAFPQNGLEDLGIGTYNEDEIFRVFVPTNSNSKMIDEAGRRHNEIEPRGSFATTTEKPVPVPIIPTRAPSHGGVCQCYCPPCGPSSSQEDYDEGPGSGDHPNTSPIPIEPLEGPLEELEPGARAEDLNLNIKMGEEDERLKSGTQGPSSPQLVSKDEDEEELGSSGSSGDGSGVDISAGSEPPPIINEDEEGSGLEVQETRDEDNLTFCFCTAKGQIMEELTESYIVYPNGTAVPGEALT